MHIGMMYVVQACQTLARQLTSQWPMKSLTFYLCLLKLFEQKVAKYTLRNIHALTCFIDKIIFIALICKQIRINTKKNLFNCIIKVVKIMSTSYYLKNL